MTIDKKEIRGTNMTAEIQWSNEKTPQLLSVTLRRNGDKVAIAPIELFPLKNFIENVLVDKMIQERTKIRKE